MKWDDVNKMEKEYLKLLLGDEPRMGDDFRLYATEFVNRSFREKEELEKIQNKAAETHVNDTSKTYFEIYHSMLLIEIRDLKIKKIC